MAGHIRVTGPFPPPNPFLYPNGRKTESHVYQVLDDNGRKLVGGSFGADTAAALAYAKRQAAAKGFEAPTVEIITPAAGEA